MSSWSADGDASKVEFKRTKVSEVMSSRARKVNSHPCRVSVVTEPGRICNHPLLAHSQIAAGAECFFLITVADELYTWGKCLNGEMGMLQSSTAGSTVTLVKTCSKVCPTGWVPPC